MIDELLDHIVKIEHGFRHIIDAGQKILSNSDLQHLDLAQTFIKSSRPYQIRMLGTYLLGEISSTDHRALELLEHIISEDENWRVQEMLAKAFDQYCRNTGYRNSLTIIESWIEDERINIKRAVTEGLRIWTNRDFFKEYPKIAIDLISKNKNTDSLYLRKSIGNALRDISKKFSKEIDSEISNWDQADHKIKSIIKLIKK